MTKMRTVGRYEIVGELGRGGMAIVHKARDTDSGEIVALKELAGQAGLDPTARERFVRSARVASSLTHPNVVRVRDVFEWEDTPYLAMEYVEWGSLRPWLSSLTPAQFAGVFESALAAVGYISQHGIVHRDLKPENLLVSGSGQVKISDFALAKAIRETGAPGVLTPSGTAVGTPTYMAPEQATGHVGPRTDLYALGCIAYEVLVGHVPFDNRESPLYTLSRRVTEDVPTPVSLVPFILCDFSDWVTRLLARDPGCRPESAESAWRALETLIVRFDGPRWRDSAALLPPPPPRPPPATASAARGFETMHECPTCGEFTPLHEDFCLHCGEYLRWDPTGQFSAITPDSTAPAAAAPPVAAREPPEPQPHEHETPMPARYRERTPIRPGSAAPDHAPRRRWGWRRRSDADEVPAHEKPDAAAPITLDHLPVVEPPLPAESSLVGAPSSAPVLIHRTPHLDVTPASPLTVGSLFEVSVYADEGRARRRGGRRDPCQGTSRA